MLPRTQYCDYRAYATQTPHRQLLTASTKPQLATGPAHDMNSMSWALYSLGHPCCCKGTADAVIQQQQINPTNFTHPRSVWSLGLWES